MLQDPNAYDTDSASAELALSNVGGVFLVLGVGTSLAFLFAIIEFLWNVHSVSVEEHVSKKQQQLLLNKPLLFLLDHLLGGVQS